MNTKKLGVDLWNLFNAVPAEIIDRGASKTFANQLIELLQTIRDGGASLQWVIAEAMDNIEERKVGGR